MKNTMNYTKINITNNTVIDAVGEHTKRNRKSVYIVEKKMACISMTDAAEVIGCSIDAVSNTIRGKQKTCRGYHLIDLSKAGEAFPQMIACLSETNTHRTKANRKANEIEMTTEEVKEFRKWKADREAKRKAEEKIRKAEEKAQKRKAKHEAEKVKLQAYINKHTSIREKAMATVDVEDRKIMKAERKLEALLDKEVM